MTEERVTKHILNWLESSNWTLVCYDFPQSGTGILLHPNEAIKTEKNKGGIIPDIIAVKQHKAVFFENKNRFYKADFDKLKEIKTNDKYSEALSTLLKGHEVRAIYYGIGMPHTSKNIDKAREHLAQIDFLVVVDNEGQVAITYDNSDIFK